jgi:neutral ceramidase
MLIAGTAISDITPKEPLLLAGYPSPKDRTGNIVHDPLYCSAFYLSADEDILLICLDLVYVTKKQTMMIREGISSRTGLKPQNISVSCTHTHSGPITFSSFSKPFDEDDIMYPEYMSYCINMIITTGIRAVNENFPAVVGYSSSICGRADGIGGNRHNRDGVTDEEVYAIGIKDSTGRMRGVIASYSLHPTLLHAESFAYSADYPGYMREFISLEYPGCVFGFHLGTSGNQSSRFFRSGQTFEEAQRFGFTIGLAAKKALEKAEYIGTCQLRCKSLWIDPILKDFPSLQESKADVDKARQALEDSRKANDSYSKQRTLECTLIGAQRMADLCAELAMPKARDAMMRSYPFEIQAVRIGELAVLLIAGEVFVEIGLEIKRKSRSKHTYIATTSNGTCLGYICTPEAYDSFCYEALGTVMKADMAEKIIEKSLEAIDNVFGI